MQKKILVIDDSVFQRNKVCSLLAELGYGTLQAKDGVEGLEILKNLQPDCVLCDLLMPNMDGFSFLEEFRKQQQKCPVFVVTADVQQTSRNRCKDLGVVDILYKPINLAQLQQALKKLFS